MTTNRNWISREEQAEIFDALATRRPAQTEAEQRTQKLRSEQAAGLRANEAMRSHNPLVRR